jgi:anti-anti-sigma factor
MSALSRRLDVTVTRRDAALVVGVAGGLDSSTSSRLEEELLGLIANAEIRLVLDCSQLVCITSAGLRAVLLAAKKLKNMNGSIVLCGLNHAVWTVFEAAGFTRILSIRPTIEEALAEFSAR